MKKIYGILSIVFLLFGVLIYSFFRNMDILIFSWLPKLVFIDRLKINLSLSTITSILIFNIPDMLWFLSGILFIRFLWIHNCKIQNIYLTLFYIIAFSIEISQLSKVFPGTFDVFDLLFMGFGAFVESLLQKIFRWRNKMKTI